ncbi:hypothetical protein GCM10009850_121270 [Nonomuraea monospora]|uniref:Transposase n=1 Tax=Nonomuraea monospora TaxID=568818 RepID=A0ABN3D573_9ACTN
MFGSAVLKWRQALDRRRADAKRPSITQINRAIGEWLRPAPTSHPGNQTRARTTAFCSRRRQAARMYASSAWINETNCEYACLAGN